jgi:hypothetical protein
MGYVVSRDGGASWTMTETLDLPVGGAYSHDLEVDTADNLHLVIPVAWANLPLNPVHMVRSADGGWSEPVPIARNACEGASTDVEIMLEGGNHLHTVWYDVEECLLGWVPPSGRGEVFYSDYVADAPTQARPMSSQAPNRPIDGILPAITSTVSSDSVGALPTASRTSVRAVNPSHFDGLPVNGLVVGVGVTAAVLILAALLILLGKGHPSA